jgi:hypothetical protein
MKPLLCIALFVLAFVLPGTVLGNGRMLEFPAPPNAGSIGTQVDGISTAVHSVTVAEYEFVRRYGLLYIEVRGEIEGVGWGGVDRSNAFKQTHYDYRYPYVLRMPFGWDGTLVVHRHGTGPITLWEGLEASLGERNFARDFHETADRVLADAALHPSRRWAFFAVNQTPVAPGGAYNTHMISDDPSLNGTPLHSILDVPVGRDFALVAKRLMKLLYGREPRITLGTGHSGGAGVNFMLNAGVDHLRGPSPILAGDNNVRPYDPSSGKIYDGFLSWARGGGALVPVDASRGVSVPTVFLEGEVDVGAALTVRQIDEMIAKGVDPQKAARLYMVHNLPHIDAGLVSTLITEGRDFGAVLRVPESFYGGGGEHLRPLAGALLDALQAWVKKGTAPPTSVFPGTASDEDATPGVEKLAFARLSGDPALAFPYVDDPVLDTIVAPPPTATQNNPALAQTWLRVRDALGATTGSIVLPETACRRGAFSFISSGPVGTAFVPFDAAAFAGRWGTAAAHQTCRVAAVGPLAKSGLYDSNVVQVDIRPDVFPNSIDRASTDVLPVAILSTKDFDATKIIPATVRLAGSSLQGQTNDRAPVGVRRQDVNGDARRDLVLEFAISKLEFRDTDLVADVWGWTWELEPFVGSDLIALQ